MTVENLTWATASTASTSNSTNTTSVVISTSRTSEFHCHSNEERIVESMSNYQIILAKRILKSK